MKVDLTLKEYTRADGSKGTNLLITTPKGTSMVVSDYFKNKKLEYKIKCEVKESK